DWPRRVNFATTWHGARLPASPAAPIMRKWPETSSAGGARHGQRNRDHHTMPIRPLLAGLMALLVAPLATPASAQTSGQNIGVAAAVQNDVVGVVRGSSRALSSGQSVVRDQTIRTGDASMAQLLFLDETSLSVGPRSEVT